MGLLSNLFGGKPQYPALDSEGQAAERLNQIRDCIESLAGEIKDPLEIVPAEAGAFIYIGKPPKRFGMAWVENGEVKKFKTFAEENKLQATQLNKLYEDLRDAYEQHQAEPRYTTEMAGRDLVVIPSNDLSSTLQHIITSASN